MLGFCLHFINFHEIPTEEPLQKNPSGITQSNGKIQIDRKKDD